VQQGVTHYTNFRRWRSSHWLRVPAAARPGNRVPVVSYGGLRNRLAYPKRDYRQWLTGVKIAIFIARGWPARAMWDYLEKEWAVRGPGEGARSEPVLTTGLHSLALAQTLRSARRTQHFAGGPPGPIRQNVE